MINTIINELTIELKNEVDFDAALLALKVNNAYREVKAARHYPKTYSETSIKEDMNDYYSNVKNIALYDYTKIGAEGQTSYSADGEKIDYIAREKLFAGVIPIARV